MQPLVSQAAGTPVSMKTRRLTRSICEFFELYGVCARKIVFSGGRSLQRAREERQKLLQGLEPRRLSGHHMLHPPADGPLRNIRLRMQLNDKRLPDRQGSHLGFPYDDFSL